VSKARLYGLWRSATVEERETGRQWYPSAYLEACELADRHHVSLGTAAGVIAALSPNSQWEQNLLDADNVLGARFSPTGFDEVKVTTYNANKRKACDIVHSGDVFPTLSGPKVTTFYHNICGDESIPTIDSHIINAWYGHRRTGARLPGVKASRVDDIRSDIIHCAFKVGVSPAVFQATIWTVHIRRIKQGKVSGYER
jgi:hypothetical protein